jgi:predicted NACHT family NTPase
VADPALRQRTVQWVQQQMIVYGNNRFVITSRPFGYRSNPLSGVAVLEVQPFTFEQVKQFVHNWYVANEIKSAVRDDPGVRMKAHEGAEDLLRRLRETPSLFALAVNPLLLTMIATVHRYRGSLPGARVTL